MKLVPHPNTLALPTQCKSDAHPTASPLSLKPSLAFGAHLAAYMAGWSCQRDNVLLNQPSTNWSHGINTQVEGQL